MAAYARRPTEQATQQPEAQVRTDAPAFGAALEEGPPAPGGGDVHAQHDSPTHIGIGDSVSGEGVVVHGIAFTPGELSALVDFVGDLTELDSFTMPQLASMKALLAKGDESARSWDAATGGRYSELAQGNESHFAPGPGADFRDSFVQFQGCAIEEAIRAQTEADPDVQEDCHRRALLYGYTAEHFLQDAFSAGHHVAAGDIEAQVDGTLDAGGNEAVLAELYDNVAQEVFARVGDTIACWGFRLDTPLGPILSPIDSLTEFSLVVHKAARTLGRGGVQDAVRQEVHEQLALTGVEVASVAHPEPWVTRGDHGLEQDEEGSAALQTALAACRDQIALEAVPGVKGEVLARQLFDRHAPRPTEDGAALVRTVLDGIAGGPLAIAAAVAATTTRNIVDVMDNVARESGGWVGRIRDPEPHEPHERPEFDFYDRDKSRIPEGPAEGAPLEEEQDGPVLDPVEVEDPQLGDRLPGDGEPGGGGRERRDDRRDRRDDRRERRDDRRDRRDDRREARRDRRDERRARP